MKHIAAYLLLQTGGNSSPSAADVKALLDTVGIEADDSQLDKLISELEGKDINEVSGVSPCIYPGGIVLGIIRCYTSLGTVGHVGIKIGGTGQRGIGFSLPTPNLA